MPFLAAIPVGVVIGASIAATVASTAVAAASAIQQAQAQRNAANYNAQVAANNAQVTEWQRGQQDQEYARQGQLIAQQGSEEASRMEQKNRADMASHINNALTSGVTLSGSALDTTKGAAINDELDVLGEQYNTNLQLYANQERASNADYNSLVQERAGVASSSLLISQGQNAITSGAFSATGSIIGGVSRVGNTLDSMNRYPNFGSSTDNYLA